MTAYPHLSFQHHHRPHKRADKPSPGRWKGNVHMIWSLMAVGGFTVATGMMTWSAGEWAIFIGACAAGIIGIIGAWRGGKAGIKSAMTDAVPTIVEQATAGVEKAMADSPLPTTKEQLDAFAKRIAKETAEQIVKQQAESPRIQT